MKLKKFITSIATLSFITSNCILSANSLLNGDANEDGNVNVRDCAHIAKCLAQGMGDSLPAVADYNGDNKINVRDASSLASDLVKGDSEDSPEDIFEVSVPSTTTVYIDNLDLTVSGSYTTQFNYDIDQDGIKETIAKYKVSPSSISSFINEKCSFYCIYDNGQFVDAFSEFIGASGARFYGVVYNQNNNNYYMGYSDYGHNWGYTFEYIYPTETEVISADYYESTGQIYQQSTTLEEAEAYMSNIISVETGEPIF